MAISTNLYEEGKYTNTLLKPQLAAVSMRWSISNLPLEQHHSCNTISITHPERLKNSQMFMYSRIGPFYGEFHKCHNADKIQLYRSPPFVTAQTGYKMCIEAYLNGKGTAYNTHLSLSFILVKGEYEAVRKPLPCIIVARQT